MRRFLAVVVSVGVVGTLVLTLLVGSSSADTVGTLFVDSDRTLTQNHLGNVIIGADGVTLDCAGFEVTGTGEGFGISVIDRAGVIVRNCEVSGFRVGIWVESSDGNTIEGNHVHDNVVPGEWSVGIDLRESSNTTVRDCDVSGSSRGIVLDISDFNVVEDNDVHDNVGPGETDFLVGIEVRDAADNIIRGNLVTGNGTDGIHVTSSDRNILENNAVTDNGRSGIGLGWANDNVLTGNSANGNAEHGISLYVSDGNTLSDNQATDNTGDGFALVEDSDRNTLLSNYSVGNAFQGFSITGSVASTGNTFRDNYANNNLWHGILDESTGGAGDYGTDNTYAGNLCIGNPTGSSPTGLCITHGETVNLVEPNGYWHLRRVNGTTHSFWYGMTGDVPLLGDWDGDGYDTPGMYRPTNGFAYLTNTLPPDGGAGSGDPALTFFFGGPGDQVFVGDWDGDGIDTLGISRNGKIYLANTNATVIADQEFWFGTPTDIAFGGDPDRDGKDGVFLYRPTSGFTYFTDTAPTDTNAVAPTDGTLFFGIPTDRFVIGDWNGDGIDSVGVFRPSNTTVYCRNLNTTGAHGIAYIFGQPTWLPVAGIWY